MKTGLKIGLIVSLLLLCIAIPLSAAQASEPAGTIAVKADNETSMNTTTSAQGSAPWLTSPGLNTEEQGLYHFPRDHQWHSGPTYHFNDFDEWHYFTLLGKDLTTGHNISLFVCDLQQGWRNDIQRPNTRVLMAYLDKDEAKFYGHGIDPTGKFVTTGSNGDFNYTVGEVGKDQGFATNYSYSQERWNFKGWATNESNITVGTPYNFDVTGIVKVPGYIPMAYWGLENIGFNDQYDQNPSTMYGLSYYYVAPEMEMNGMVTLDDGVAHEIEGIAWFEHQWGNFQSPEQLRYFWGYARFPNGDSFTWRQYYGSPAGVVTTTIPFNITAAMMGWDSPQIQQNRFAFVPKGQPPQYAFGPSIVYTPIKWWTSPITNMSYPWWGELKTPKGTFFISPSATPSQESPGAAGPFIEGALELHSGSIDGPVVAEGFCELAQLSPLGAPNARGLPEATAPGDIHFDGGLNHSVQKQN